MKLHAVGWSLFFAYSGTFFKEEMTCFKLHRKLQSRKENRFPHFAGSGFDHIFDHRQVRNTWKQWKLQVRKARWFGAESTRNEQKRLEKVPTILWDQDAASSSLATRINSNHRHCLYWAVPMIENLHGRYLYAGLQGYVLPLSRAYGNGYWCPGSYHQCVGWNYRKAEAGAADDRGMFMSGPDEDSQDNKWGRERPVCRSFLRGASHVLRLGTA